MKNIINMTLTIVFGSCFMALLIITMISDTTKLDKLIITEVLHRTQ